MNRLLHAYLELDPELADYFITSSRDDIRGVMQTMGVKAEPGSGLGDLLHGMVILPGTMSVIVGVAAGALAAMIVSVFGGPPTFAVIAGGAAFLVTTVVLMGSSRAGFMKFGKALEGRFPSDPG